MAVHDSAILVSTSLSGCLHMNSRLRTMDGSVMMNSIFSRCQTVFTPFALWFSWLLPFVISSPCQVLFHFSYLALSCLQPLFISGSFFTTLPFCPHTHLPACWFVSPRLLTYLVVPPAFGDLSCWHPASGISPILPVWG